MLTQSLSVNGDYLTYDDEKHSYVINGSIVPGVTSVIHLAMPEAQHLVSWKIKQGSLFTINQLSNLPLPINKMPEDVLTEVVKSSTVAYRKETRKAADIGTILHDYAESVSKGQVFDMIRITSHDDAKKITNCVKEFDKYWKLSQDELLSTEEVVGSSKHMFAGKYDLLTKRKNKIVLKDYKTSSGIYTSQFIQLAAYAYALDEWKGIHVNSLEIVRFGKGGDDFEVKEIKLKKQVKELTEQFFRCRQTYAFIKEYGC